MKKFKKVIIIVVALAIFVTTIFVASKTAYSNGQDAGREEAGKALERTINYYAEFWEAATKEKLPGLENDIMYTRHFNDNSDFKIYKQGNKLNFIYENR